jgi:hypothetical protein
LGSIRIGPPSELVLAVASRCNARTFVETGTFLGATARWASKHFEQVVTIEREETLHEQAVNGSRGCDNIEFVLGDSRDALKTLVPRLSSSAVFWLDGHWSGGRTSGVGDECPVLGELDAIHSSDIAHSVFIDDARLFVAAPPPPHDPEQWPAIDELILMLQTPARRYSIALLEDVIVAVPPSARADLVDYARRIAPQARKSRILRRGTRKVKRLPPAPQR